MIQIQQKDDEKLLIQEDKTSSIQEIDEKLSNAIKQIEQLLIKELDTYSDNLCFYKDSILV